MDKVSSVKALMHITGDGLLNLPRVDAEIGFVIDELPPPPPLFGLIEKLGGGRAGPRCSRSTTWGSAFASSSPKRTPTAMLTILARHRRKASVIGHAVADPTKSVQLPREKLVGAGKKFRPA